MEGRLCKDKLSLAQARPAKMTAALQNDDRHPLMKPLFSVHNVIGQLIRQPWKQSIQPDAEARQTGQIYFLFAFLHQLDDLGGHMLWSHHHPGYTFLVFA